MTNTKTNTKTKTDFIHYRYKGRHSDPLYSMNQKKSSHHKISVPDVLHRQLSQATFMAENRSDFGNFWSLIHIRNVQMEPPQKTLHWTSKSVYNQRSYMCLHIHQRPSKQSLIHLLHLIHFIHHIHFIHLIHLIHFINLIHLLST